MGCSGLLTLGLALSVGFCLELQGPSGEPNFEITRNITAVLGEEVYLICVYLGENKIDSAQWKRQKTSKVKSKRLAGFVNGVPFGRNGFSEPDSLTNLTVRMNVSSVEVEGEYICEFESEEEDYANSIFLTVVARADIQIQVTAETINGSHYQSVSCSAVGSRPLPQISWLVRGLPALDYPFTVSTNSTAHSNGTSTLSSILRFPTHLQDEDSVTCVVQHPTFSSPKVATARVETYTMPNVTVKADLVQQGRSEFWVVSCISSGGRPDTLISLAFNTDEELQKENNTDSDIQTSKVFLPAAVYEGQNVTCVFDHPKFTHKESRVMTLPSFYLSGVQLFSSDVGNTSYELIDAESLQLQEGQSDTVISLQVTGNVPRYNVTCKRDDGIWPEEMEVVGSHLAIHGPVGLQHAGLYECLVSYRFLQVTVKFNVTVEPHVTHVVPPMIQIDLQTEGGHRRIECSAADAVPAANMSWLLPEGVSGVSWFNFTSHNGSHTVEGVLLLPACSPWEHTVLCLINHPAFKEPENRSVTLPVCAHPNITINSLTEWETGEEYTKVECSVDSVVPAAAITWHVGDNDKSISYLSEMELRSDGSVSVHSSVHILSSLYSGQNLTCSVAHPSLKAPEKRTIHIVVHKAPLLNVSVERRQDSPLWLAVCDCRGETVSTSLAWVLPENAQSQTFMQSEYEGKFLKTSVTYQFDLAQHEGQNLTCVYHYERGATEKTLHIPRYYISAVRVLNHTTPLQSRYSGETITHRLTLQENQRDQRILLQVEGNTPEFKLNCKRSDGSSVQMEEAAMVFQSEVSEQDEGLYTCQASFYHHTATVTFQVDVMSEDKLFALSSLVCISTATAISLIFIVTFWVCCIANRTQHKWQESLPPLTARRKRKKKPPVMEDESKEHTQLISYSIVIDVKSTV